MDEGTKDDENEDDGPQNERTIYKANVTYDSAFLKARDCAIKGDANGMIVALYELPILDALKGHAQKQTLPGTPGISRDDADLLVAEAIDKVYQKARDGHMFKYGLRTYLFKAVRTTTIDFLRTRPPVTLVDFDDDAVSNWVQTNSLRSTSALSNGDPHQDISAIDRDELKAEALQIARQLVPKLGSEKNQNVMTYLLDAVMTGEEDVTNIKIAEALGYTHNTVAQCKKRSFERMARIAEAEGLGDICWGRLNEDDTENDDIETDE